MKGLCHFLEWVFVWMCVLGVRVFLSPELPPPSSDIEEEEEGKSRLALFLLPPPCVCVCADVPAAEESFSPEERERWREEAEDEQVLSKAGVTRIILILLIQYIYGRTGSI